MSFIYRERRLLVSVPPIIVIQQSLTSLSISNQFLQYGIWMYLMVFVIIMLGSTVVGGLIPDNTFLFLTGAVARVNGLSMEWLLLIAVGGGFVGYEINYWSGRLFGMAMLRGLYRNVLQDKNVRKALDKMEGFGPVTLTLGRVMPVLNLPSFIAGVDRMDYQTFVGFNLISSAVWGLGILMLGYFFGGIPVINKYAGYFTGLLIIFIGIASIIALVMFARNYAKRNNSPIE
jgi:membrane-associated protein